MPPHLPPEPHALPTAGLAAELESDASLGLTTAEAESRLAVFGGNVLPKPKPVSPLLTFIKQFHGGLTYVLLVAAVVSFFLGDVRDAVGILVVILIDVIFGFVQERRADAAVAKLKEMVVPEATVIRSGEVLRVPAVGIVPGDVILLGEGDRVPADARLVAARNLRTDESTLTGESLPVGKGLDALPPQTPLPERKNMVFMGTAVVAGTGRALVAATGGRTALGQVAGSLIGIRRGRTPFEKAVDRLGWRLGLVSAAVVGVISAIGLWRGEKPADLFLFAVALAVAVIPEGLPSVLTVVLAIGVWRMAKRRAVVRHVPSVETLGETDVICTDKTGTLTRNQMTVRDIALFGLDVRVSGEGYDPTGEFTAAGRPLVPAEIPPLALLLKAAALGTAACIVRRQDDYSVAGDPTEGALAVVAAKAGYDRRTLEGEWRVVDDLPFASDRKLRAVLAEGVDYAGRRSRILFVVGAFEVLAAKSTAYLETAAKPMDRPAADRFAQANFRLASQARRVVALAIREMPESATEIKESDLDGLTLLGLAGLLDPPRPEAAKAISRCRRAGIRVIMITGDQKATAVAVAREIGLLDSESAIATETATATATETATEINQVFSGDQVEKMSDKEFDACLAQAVVFARVTPQTKLRLVAALKRLGLVVAMTGDGVNDAPALKMADIGVAMGRGGTDVARAVSDMVLMDDNFATIVNAVEEGRVVFRNVKQTTAYLFATNMAEAATMLLALAAGLPLPLLAGQVLWMNLVTDGFPDIALATEPAGDGVLDRPLPRRHQTFLTPNVLFFTLVSALVMCTVTFGLFAWSWGNSGDLTRARTVAFTAMCFFQLWNVFNLRSETVSLFRLGLRSNMYVVWAVAASFLLQLAVIYLPFLNRIFRVVPLDWKEMAIILAVTVLVIPAVEGYKWLLRRGMIPRSWI